MGIYLSYDYSFLVDNGFMKPPIKQPIVSLQAFEKKASLSFGGLKLPVHSSQTTCRVVEVEGDVMCVVPCITDDGTIFISPIPTTNLTYKFVSIQKFPSRIIVLSTPQSTFGGEGHLFYLPPNPRLIYAPKVRKMFLSVLNPEGIYSDCDIDRIYHRFLRYLKDYPDIPRFGHITSALFEDAFLATYFWLITGKASELATYKINDFLYATNYILLHGLEPSVAKKVAIQLQTGGFCTFAYNDSVIVQVIYTPLSSANYYTMSLAKRSVYKICISAAGRSIPMKNPFDLPFMMKDKIIFPFCQMLYCPSVKFVAYDKFYFIETNKNLLTRDTKTCIMLFQGGSGVSPKNLEVRSFEESV